VRSRVKAVVLAVLIGPLSQAAPAADSVKSAPPTSAALAPAADAVKSADPTSAALTPAAIVDAIADLRHDPNLGGQTKIRTLRWVTKSQPQPPPAAPGWMSGLFEYAGQFGGLLLWVAGIGAVAMAAVWIFRLLKSREPSAVPAPAHVGDRRVLGLDIQPDSLPDDVGAAALELLRAGRMRDSLSLLYRASLSSAVHRFGVAIGAHHTEREVLGAVRGALDEPRARYFADLVTTRQRVVYAGEVLAPDAVLPLCAGFSTFFDPQPP
jgi:hypothetical protein